MKTNIFLCICVLLPSLISLTAYSDSVQTTQSENSLYSSKLVQIDYRNRKSVSIGISDKIEVKISKSTEIRYRPKKNKN